jgi:hypothetical protein
MGEGLQRARAATLALYRANKEAARKKAARAAAAMELLDLFEEVPQIDFWPEEHLGRGYAERYRAIMARAKEAL